MNRKSIVLTLAAAVVLSSFVVCQAQRPGPPAPPPGISTEKFSGDELIVSYGKEKLLMKHARLYNPEPDIQWIKRFSDWWLETTLLAEEAKKQHLDKSEKAKFRVDMGVKSAYAGVLNEETLNAVKVTDEETLAFYEKNKDTEQRLRDPVRLSFSHISVESLEKAQELVDKIKAGADINELAKTNSKNRDAEKGGVVLKMPESTTSRNFGRKLTDALLASSEGKIIGPVKGKAKFYEVARHEGKLAAKAKPFKNVKEQIQSQLLQTAKREATQNLLTSLKEKAESKIKKSEVIFEKQDAPEDADAKKAKPAKKK